MEIWKDSNQIDYSECKDSVSDDDTMDHRETHEDLSGGRTAQEAKDKGDQTVEDEDDDDDDDDDDDEVEEEEDSSGGSIARSYLLDVPSDLLSHIVSALLPNDFFKLKCVSKSLRSILSDPSFIEKIRFHPLILVQAASNRILGLSLDTSTHSPKNVCKFPSPEKTKMFGSCEGFLFVKGYPDELHVFNPIIGEGLELPAPQFDFHADPAVFGFGKSKNSLKVVLISTDDVLLYTIGVDETWRRKEKLRYPLVSRYWLEDQKAVYLNGYLYWTAEQVLALDLEHERFSEMLLPPQTINLQKETPDYNPLPVVGVLGGQLVLLANVGMNMHLYAREDEKCSFWNLKLVVRDERLTLETEVISYGSDGSIILVHSEELKTIRPTDNTFTPVAIGGITKVMEAGVLYPSFQLLETKSNTKGPIIEEIEEVEETENQPQNIRHKRQKN